MELTVLGTAGTWPPAGGATCGFLVSHEGTNMRSPAGSVLVAIRRLGPSGVA